MIEIRNRLNALRMELLRRNLDAFFISGTDPHFSEYLPERWKIRRFLTGFTGSYGVVVVAQEGAGLWTDSRYFLQAEEEIKGSGYKLFRLRLPESVAPEVWLSKKLASGSKVGYDPQTLSVAAYRNLSGCLHQSNIETVEASDVFDKIWEDRPDLPDNPIFELGEEMTGLSRKDKRELVNQKLRQQSATLHVVTSLDEIAWLFNLRGSDIEYNPVFTGYGVVGIKTNVLFADTQKISPTLRQQLEKERIVIMPYDAFRSWTGTIKQKKILLNPDTTSVAVYNALQSENIITEGESPIAHLKAQKNDIEVKGFREAMIKDGVALIEFLYWLRQNLTTGQVSEYSASQKLSECRAKQNGYVGESFASIFGYKDHGAIVHLSVNEKEAYVLEPEGILLFDSGGQYLHGTTDITRTIALGPVSAQQKIDFTLVLKGMIALTMIQFPAGTRGCNLDVVARTSLWKNGLNYGHGTGHGIGHFLNVHEGPVSIRQDLNDLPFREGMIVSNEPGLYREGLYGIRIENLLVCEKRDTTDFGTFLGFDTLTLCPIDTDLVEKSMLHVEELKWLNNYNKRVKSELEPRIDNHLKSFLSELTKEI